MPTQIITTGELRYANARWLLQLRWVAVVGQIATIIGAMILFQMQLPMVWTLIAVIALTAITNIFLKFWISRWRRIDQHLKQDNSPLPWNLLMGLVLILDILSLTALLWTTGGPNNPFCLFFFVNLCLSALLLDRSWAWGINALTIFCFSLLMFEHYSVEQLDLGLNRVSNWESFTLEHMGFLAAFATCSGVIVYFMTRLAGELAEQQSEVRKAQQLQSNSEKVEALGTLAAGTAHELATPLSTIAIVARDVEQAFEKHPPDFPGAEDVIEDVHLIRSQLERCRGILDRMSSHAGETIGESIQPTTIEDITLTSLEGIIERGRVEVTIDDADKAASIPVPRDALCQAVRGLVQNAIDADPSDRAVTIQVASEGEFWLWKIRDQGHGMSPEQLSRVSEPFFTTKPPGKGMGLGVFLANNVIRRLGGSVTFESKPGKGTLAAVRLPKAR